MPKIEDAPGLVWRRLKLGWEARWLARSDLVGRGFKPRIVRLWASEPDEIEPNEISRAFIKDRCNGLQAEMLAWGHGVTVEHGYDDTIAALVNFYQTHRKSPYVKPGKLEHATKKYYARLCTSLIKDLSDRKVSAWDAEYLDDWNEKYLDAGKVSMGHALATMLRTVTNFGELYLKVPEVVRAAGILTKMRFENGKARTEILTVQQVIAIRRAAPKSIALAQALQFEMTLRQKDVIGEWVPLSEPGLSAVTFGNEKWIKGLDWKEIDANWICRHVTSKRKKEITIDLKLAAMVVEELGSTDRDDFPATGPVIVCEKTGLPWTGSTFRKAWRDAANVAHVPAHVRNMDTRAGAITEAIQAGGDMESVRKAATHSDQAMTQRYSRADDKAIATVMTLRKTKRET